MKSNTKENIIVEHLAGSKAYGTSTPESDTDIRGVFCADQIQVRTPFFPVREVNMEDEEDGKLYELNTFMKLYCDMNPNIVETLWVDETSIIQTSPAYQHLRDHRDQLLSSKVAFTFSGYALAQLKRIKGHDKWINNPQPAAAPRQTDYITLVHNFTSKRMFKLNIYEYQKGYRLIPYGDNLFGLYDAPGYDTFDDIFTLNTNSEHVENFYTKEQTFKDKIIGLLNNDPNYGVRRLPLFIVKFNKEEYKRACEVHTNYWTWKRNRNEKRAALEEKNGYDTKHGMHLVRLLRMGEEILETGKVNVFRPDAAELLAIRNGAWSYDEMVEYAETKDKHIREVLYKSTSLPKTTDIKLAAKLTVECQDMMWSKKK